MAAIIVEPLRGFLQVKQLNLQVSLPIFTSGFHMDHSGPIPWFCTWHPWVFWGVHEFGHQNHRKSPTHQDIWLTPLKINGWNMSSWRFGRSFYFLNGWFVGAMLFFQGVAVGHSYAGQVFVCDLTIRNLLAWTTLAKKARNLSKPCVPEWF